MLKMTQSIRHRGPDDEGYLAVHSQQGFIRQLRGDHTIPEVREKHLLEDRTGPQPDILLGWRRLGIIDLSPAGHQPMASADGSLWLIFNGEVYNYLELRDELVQKGHSFRTHSDTEVVLEAYTEWGSECLQHFNGMWAMAIWDNRKRELFCARDRFGVKPFYYVWDGTTLGFASEIKAILELPWVAREANDDMVYDFLVHRVIDHTDQTMFKGIHQLRPGHWMMVGSRGMHIERYYELNYEPGLGRYREDRAKEYSSQFADCFADAVRLRLRSDVAIGSCLSGGVDSSSIVCTANRLIFDQGLADRSTIGDRQKTFTASYDLPQYSEDAFVQQVIKRTNADAHVVKPTAQGLWDDLTDFLRSNDEPMISTSMYAQWNVMKLAAQHGIKVLLDGQGADELLAGYRRWHFPVFHAQLFRQGRLREFYHETKQSASIAGESWGSHLQFAAQKALRNLIPGSWRRRMVAPSDLMNEEFVGRAQSRVDKRDVAIQERLWDDETHYNLQQLLHYEDRNSMHFSIEARVPFVDYRLVELAMNMPAVYKIHDGWSKYVLRRAMAGTVPEDIRWRRDKMGFVTPEAEWEEELMPRILELLRSQAFRAQRFIDGSLLLGRLEGPKRGLTSYDTWRFINLELWMRIFSLT